MATEKLLFIPPNESALQGLIKLYYWHSSLDKDFYQHINYFPNYTCTLNIYKNSDLHYDHLSRHHRPASQKGFLKLLVGKFNLSRALITEGPFQKLSIVFHPLGLNHFVKEPLGRFIEEHFSFFNYFDPALDKLLPLLFEESDMEEKRDLLDRFFLKQLYDFPEVRLQKAIQIIFEEEEALRVNDLAKRIGISRKTLLRLFRKHLNYSIEEYLAVV